MRVAHARPGHLDNPAAWLTTVVARVSLNLLRARTSRREHLVDDPGRYHPPATGPSPEDVAALAESVGLAMLVVLDTLSPAERVAFVLHDMFDLPFEKIAALLGRSAAATRQLASRARRKIHGRDLPTTGAGLGPHWRLVTAYLSAIRDGDLDALVQLLHPDVTLRADPQATPHGEPVALTAVDLVVRAALASVVRARGTELALINGQPGLG